MTDIKSWYTETVRDATVNAVAERSDVVQSTLNRQLHSGSFSPEVVVAIARAYGVDVLDALVALGLIDQQDIRRHGIDSALRDALDVEIAAEVGRRLGGSNRVFDAPMS